MAGKLFHLRWAGHTCSGKLYVISDSDSLSGQH